MATIVDVAKLAGVTPTTVSRVINNRGYISEKTKSKVHEAMDQLSYQPNEIARSLTKQRSNTIGVIVPHISHPYFSKLISNLENEAAKKDYKIILCNSKDTATKEKKYLDICKSNRVDGIILCSGNVEYNMINTGNIPIVLLEKNFEKGKLGIQCDNYQGGCLATEHLIKCGCKNIVCMRGPQSLSSAKQRYLGYRDICKEYGLNEQYIECDYSYESGLKKTKELIKKYPDVDGIIASNDMVAISIYKVISKKGYCVPEDIQIIGFDNISFSWLSTPEITTIAQPIKKMGKKAAQIIIQHKKGEEIEKENVFDVKLIQRQTTKIKG